MAAKLKVTQVKSTISHIARNRATVRALGLHGIGSTSVVTDNPATRGMVRAVRFLVTVEEIEDGATPDTSEKSSHETPRPPAGPRVAQATHARRPRHRRRQGQDRGPRHEGPEGTCRRRHPCLVRGRPDAAPHAHPEAPRLQEPVQDRVRGREHRRDRRARGSRRVRVRGHQEVGQVERRSRSTRTSCAPSGWSGPSTSRSRSSAPASCPCRSSSSPTRSPRPPEPRSRRPVAASTSSRSRPRRSRRWA